MQKEKEYKKYIKGCSKVSFPFTPAPQPVPPLIGSNSFQFLINPSQGFCLFQRYQISF
jgi:hypothetical protein